MHAFEISDHKKTTCMQKLAFEEKLLHAVWRREMGEVVKLAADGVSMIGNRSKLALHAAVAVGDMEIMEKLLEFGANVKAVDPSSGQTPLHVAVLKGHGKIAERLLASGQADPTLRDKSGRTPFAVAVFLDRVDMVKLLMKHGATEDELSGFSDLILNDWVKDKLVLQFDKVNNLK